MSEFERQIEEDMAMVRRGQRLPRATVHFVPEAEYRKLEELKNEPVQAAKEEPTRQEVALRLARAITPVAICASWLLGAAEGLADPVFTVFNVAICSLWAVVNFKWGAVSVADSMEQMG